MRCVARRGAEKSSAPRHTTHLAGPASPDSTFQPFKRFNVSTPAHRRGTNPTWPVISKNQRPQKQNMTQKPICKVLFVQLLEYSL
jgi:hypothetical protein